MAKNIWRRLGLLVLLGACVGPLVWPATGQDKDKKEEKKADEPIALEKLEPLKLALPTEAVDKEFAPHVNSYLLGVAWKDQDLTLLLELAEGLAAGELKLGRPHKGIKTADFFMGVARLAVVERNTAAIDRLKEAAAKAKHKDLAEQLALARKLAAAPRAAAPPLMVNVNDLTPEGLKFYRQTLTDIDNARAAGNVEELDRLAKLSKDVDGWGDKLRQHVQEQITKARESAKESETESSKLLSKLAGAARTAPGTVLVYNGVSRSAPAPGVTVTVPAGTQVVGSVANVQSIGPGTVAITIGQPSALSKTPNSYIAISGPGVPFAFVCNGKAIWMGNGSLYMFTNRVVTGTNINSFQFIGNCATNQKIVTSTDRGPVPWYLVTSNFQGGDMFAIPFDNGAFASANGSHLQVIPSATLGRIAQPGFSLVSLR